MDWKYWAFISYSSKDREWGEWLIKALEDYRIPRSLVGLKTGQGAIPQRLYPVFRDRDELRVGSDVGDELRKALLESRFLIVICSPNSADPRSWVGKEISSFKEYGRGEEVLALVVDGEPNGSAHPGGESRECFPAPLRHQFDKMGNETTQPVDPLAADVRREDPRPRVARRKALLKLIARMIDVDFDTLEQRDRRRQRQRRIVWSIASIVLLTVVAGLAGLWVSETRTALSQQLAKQARDESHTHPDRALLLGVLSYRVAKNAAAYYSIVTTIRPRQNLMAYLQHPAKVSAVAFSPDDRSLAVAACVPPSCEVSAITRYDLDTLHILGEPVKIGGEVSEVLYLASSGNLLVSHKSGIEHELTLSDLSLENSLQSLLYKSTDPLTSIQVSEDGRWYAVGMKSGEFKVFADGAGRRCGGFLNSPVGAMSFSADGDKFAALSEADMQVIKLTENDCQIIHRRPGERIAAAAFDADATNLYVVSPDGTVDRWELADTAGHQHLFSFVPAERHIHNLDRQARFMASQHMNHLRIYDLKARREIEKDIEQNPGESRLRGSQLRDVEISRFDDVDARRIVFSPSAKLVATIDSKGEVLVWSTAEQPIVETLSSDQEPTSISKEAVSPDHRLRVEVEEKTEGCGTDAKYLCRTWTELRLTDIETMQEISRLSGPHQWMRPPGAISLAFQPDGDVEVQGERWREVWRIAPQALMERACHMANRDLDDGEIDQYLSWRKWLLSVVQPCEAASTR